MIYIHYSEEANFITSQKNFSLAPNIPIEIKLVNPSLDFSGDILKGKILEMSRMRLCVFMEANLPEDECLAMSFALPEGKEISSPIVMAKKRKERFIYDIEFIVFDERERSTMIQYMFKRQIEMARVVNQCFCGVRSNYITLLKMRQIQSFESSYYSILL